MARKRRRKFRRGHAPYLGKIRFNWCDSCNVPLVGKNQCSICGEKPRKVKISPPGDPFPAMEGHLERAISTIDEHFGTDVGKKVLPSNKTIVMNKVSALDAMYEIIVDGYVIGRLRFDIPKKGYSLLLSIEGGRRIGAVSKKKWVSCYDDVIPYLRKGANLMVPGIIGCDSGIEIGDEVWLIDQSGSVIAVGTARMSGTEMAESNKGYAIKIRTFSEHPYPRINSKTSTWDDAVLANSVHLEKIESEAISFIRKIADRYDYPKVVGFSGGKDSLVTYLLVEHALKKSPPLFFMDTGLELPETIQYINDFASRHNTTIVGQDVGNRFWSSVDVFGPPARDFRWCCKVLKLGPAAKAISEEMGGNTVSFMGQRKLESFQRSIEPRVTSNPWVPGQTSANPIQRWNALEVWLYIFREQEPFNMLYNKGYHRMGCYLCPASPLAEIYSLSETHPELYRKWRDKLLEWADKFGFPKAWADYGFWRWKTLPKGQMNLIRKMDLEIRKDRPSPKQKLELNVVKGVSPCVLAGYSLEGQFSEGIDLERIANIAPIFGKTNLSEELGALRIVSGGTTINLFSSGSLVIRGNDENEIENLTKQFERATTRAIFCQSCESCIPQCKHEALIIRDGRIAVDTSMCVQCLECDNWPCPTYLA
ncbi:MAG: phosphoadenosine phosphosulfate reductase family protein [Candidatus Lokiarchaeota archaeon]|nr:phosphoadenosine phosphosulfate reductase family protein [Candidatus Lokiarchaeota archaeon]